MSDGYVCPQCGLNYDTILPPDAKAAMLSYPRRYGALFPPRDDDDKPDGVIHRRPEPTVWSALEYLMHVGDVVDELADIIGKMTVQEGQSFTMFDPDERASTSRYNEQSRDTALEHLETSCRHGADVIAGVDRDAWSRSASFAWGERDALTMTRNMVHEGYHHLRDIENVLSRVVGR